MARLDAQLVGRSLKGDQRAFGELVQRHQARILAAAIHLVGDRDAAEDLAQEAFVEAYRNLAALEAWARFGAWVYGILRNRCRHYLSRRPPQPLSWEADDVPEPAVVDPAAQEPQLIPLLNSLPQESREVLAARYLQDMSYAEIAQMLGITVANVRVRCFRAREALRQLLAQANGTPVAEGGGL